MMWLTWLFVVFVAMACSDNKTAPDNDPAWDALFVQEGMHVDTVGVRNLAKGDTTSEYPGLVVVDRNLTFPREAEGGEVFAWEFYADSINPVKLIVVRYEEGGEHIEIIGESEMIVPKNKGFNRHILREPIPIEYGCMMGFVQPKEAAIPFKNITGYKTLITARPFARPLMRRDAFSMYGWRYSLRVFWRIKNEDNS